MTTSMIVPFLAASESPTVTSATEPVENPEFAMTLGAVLASVVAAPAPALPSLPGVWRMPLDVPANGDPEGGGLDEGAEMPNDTEALTGDRRPPPAGPMAPDEQPEPLSLERGLELWLTRIAATPARVDEQSPGGVAAEPGSSAVSSPGPLSVAGPRPAETEFGLEMQLPDNPVVSPAPPVPPGSSRARPEASRGDGVPALPPVASDRPLATEQLGPAGAGSAAPRTLVGPNRRHERPGIDPVSPPTMDLDEGVSVAVMLGRRVAVESAIEIAGFGFPTGWPPPAGGGSTDLTPAVLVIGDGPVLRSVSAASSPIGEPVLRSSGEPKPPGFLPPPASALSMPAAENVVVHEAIRRAASDGQPPPLPPDTSAEPPRPRPEANGVEFLPPRMPLLRAVASGTGTRESADPDDRRSNADDRSRSKPRPWSIEPATRTGDGAAAVGFVRPVFTQSPLVAPRGPEPVGSGGPSTIPVLEPTIHVRRDEVVLQLGDEQNDVGKIRVAIHGSNVRATIIPTDPELAQRLSTGLRELRQNLEERGFADPRVVVQSPRPADSGPAPVVARDLIAEAGAYSEPKGPSRHSTPDDRRDRGSEPSARHDHRHRPPDRQRHQDHEEETQR